MRDLNAWLDQKRPYQREILFSVVFDLCALAAMAAVGTGLVLVGSLPLVSVLAAVALMATPIALIGQLAGYRIEDRRTAQIKEAHRG